MGYMIRKKGAYIPRSEIVRDYRPQRDLAPHDYVFESDEDDTGKDREEV